MSASISTGPVGASDPAGRLLAPDDEARPPGRLEAVLQRIDPVWVSLALFALALLAGGLLWGKGVSGTYETRGELKLIRRF